MFNGATKDHRNSEMPLVALRRIYSVVLLNEKTKSLRKTAIPLLCQLKILKIRW